MPRQLGDHLSRQRRAIEAIGLALRAESANAALPPQLKPDAHPVWVRPFGSGSLRGVSSELETET